MRWPWEKKASATASAIANVGMGQVQWTPRQYDKLANEAYLRNVVAYACVRKIATAAASIPWQVFIGDKEDPEHPALTRLRRPSPIHTGEEMMTAFYSHAQLSGNGYLEGVTLDGELEEIYALRPDRMKLIPGPRGWPTAYEYRIGQHTTRWDMPKEYGAFFEIAHFRMFHPLNDHYGMAPVEAAAYSIDNHNDSTEYSKRLLQNSARPSGALKVSKDNGNDGRLTLEQKQALKDQIEKHYVGVKNTGRPLLLEGDLDWISMSMDMKELNFTEQQRETARAIALGFGVPPMLLGIPGDNTYSNYVEANRAFYRDTVIPLVRIAAQKIENWLAPIYGDEFRLTYNEDRIDALSVEREAKWDRVNGSTFLSVDEKRAELGFGPHSEIEETDVFLVPSGLTPIDELGFEPGGPEPDDPTDDEEE
jgi:HK97 family phage portal protein